MTAEPKAVLIGTREAAEALAGRLETSMDALLAVVEEETRLVRTGKLIEAGALQGRKADLVAAYARDMAEAKANMTALGRLSAPAVARLRDRHAEFRSLIQINMAVLATAREVAEDLVRSVAEAVGQGERPKTYAPPGQAPNPAAVSARGLAVDRRA